VIADGVCRVDAEIHDDLHDLRRLRHDRRPFTLERALEGQLDRGLQGSAQQGECLVNLGDDVHGHRPARILLGKGKHAGDQVAGAKTAMYDLLDVALRNGLRRQFVAGQFGKSHDTGQNVVEFMGDPRGHRADRLQFARLHLRLVFRLEPLLAGTLNRLGCGVGLPERRGSLGDDFLELIPVLSLFGDIAGDSEYADQFSLAVPHGGPGGFEQRATAVVRERAPFLIDGGPVGGSGAKIIAVTLVRQGRRHEVEIRRADDVRSARAKQASKGGIAGQVHSLPVLEPDEIGYGLEQRSQLGPLRLDQRVHAPVGGRGSRRRRTEFRPAPRWPARSAHPCRTEWRERR
jgi:hypothetical protein